MSKYAIRPAGAMWEFSGPDVLMRLADREQLLGLAWEYLLERQTPPEGGAALFDEGAELLPALTRDQGPPRA